jgi:hypothetical protein
MDAAQGAVAVREGVAQVLGVEAAVRCLADRVAAAGAGRLLEGENWETFWIMEFTRTQ